MVALGLQVASELNKLKNTAERHGEWKIALIRSEYLGMVIATQQHEEGASIDLAALRESFDILTLNVNEFKDSGVFKSLLNDLTYRENVKKIDTEIEILNGLLDVGQAKFLENLDAIDRSLLRLSKPIQHNEVLAIRQIADAADRQRDEISRTLLALAGLTSALVLALLIVAVLLFRVFSLSELRVVESRVLADRLSAIVGTSLDAILLVDKEGRVIEYNGSAEKIFGYTRAEMIGRTMADSIIPEKYINAHEAGMRRYAETKQRRVIGAGRVELEARHKNGGLFPIELTIDVVGDEDDPYYVSFIRDITEEKKSEKELVEARDRALAGEKSKADFLTVMSHEMRTPLNGLIGTIELLKDAELTSEQQEHVNNLEQTSHVLVRHVNDVLNVAQYENGKIETYAQTVDLLHFLDTLLAAHRARAEKRGNELNIVWNTTPVRYIKSDPHKLQQILDNLLDNANKFTKSGHISLEINRVELNRDQCFLEYCVRDTGSGIPENQLERIFEDFVSLDTTYKRQSEDVGLGLGIARRLTRALGGELIVKSTLGTGSDFSVRLPCKILEDDDQTDETDLLPDNAVSLNILIIEDNRINRFVLRSMLEKDGHCVDEAEHGCDGVSMAGQTAYDVILMDIGMPVMDGVTATRNIRQGGGLPQNVPIFAVTAHALPEEIVTFKKAGMDDYVSKPIERRVLLEKLRRISKNVKRVVLEDVENKVNVMENSTVLDVERINEMRRDLGADVLGMLLGRFMQEAEQAMAGYLDDDAVRQREISEVIAEMHKIAGSAAALGAMEFRRRLNEIEVLGKEGNTQAVYDSIPGLNDLWLASKSELELHTAA